MITRYFTYPWGKRPVEFETYMFKRVLMPITKDYCGSGELLIEHVAKTDKMFNALVDKIETEQKIHSSDKGYKEYHKWCFEYPTKDENGNDVIMLVYLTGFLNYDD